MIPVEVPAEVKAIWDRVPKMKDCQGKCHTSCGPTPASRSEHDLIDVAAGKEALRTIDGQLGAMTCALLTDDGKCSVYGLRPLMCRVWGTSHSLPCVYGCEPEFYLTDAEVFTMLVEMTALTGDAPGSEMDFMLERMGPELAAAWEREVGRPARAAARSGLQWREATE